jgi:hypothetical protein
LGRKSAFANKVRVDGVIIEGSSYSEDDFLTSDEKINSVGLNLRSTEAAEETAAGKSSTFMGLFGSLHIRNVQVGVKVGQLCNGHTFSSITFINIKKYCYWFNGGLRTNSNNTVLGGFTHLSRPDALDSVGGVTIVKLQNAGVSTAFFGVHAEPGRNARQYDVDRTSYACMILGASISGLAAGSDHSDDLIALPGELNRSVAGSVHFIDKQVQPVQARTRGIALTAPAQHDSCATHVTGLVNDFNELLGKLRSTGVMLYP